MTTTKKVSTFANLASRKSRREEARKSGEKFVPQYNGTSPVRGTHKDVAKRLKKEQVGLA